MNQIRRSLVASAFTLSVFLMGIAASDPETKAFVAYSLKTAQECVKDAAAAGKDFRDRDPELFYLGGITKPWMAILDKENGDWILAGERDPKSSTVTLDDWVVALRARFIHPEEDPGVSIDPVPCEQCLAAGRVASCPHITQQEVRFFGGVEDTHFGEICYEADWLMKKIALGLERLPVKDLNVYFDLLVQEATAGAIPKMRVGSRFWFYPIVNRVNVLDGALVLEAFQMGVFTEVLYAEENGKLLPNVRDFDHHPSEGFSRSLTAQYDRVADVREVLEALRGLTRLAALAKGLTCCAQAADFEFFLSSYPQSQTPTRRHVDVLRARADKVGLECAGGVKLAALPMRFEEADLSQLKNAVCRARKQGPKPQLSWEFFITPASDGTMALVARQPSEQTSDIAPLLTQGAFLFNKKRYDEAIACYTEALRLGPPLPTAFYDRGLAYARKGLGDEALQDLDRAIDLMPSLAVAYNARGFVYEAQHEYDRAIAEYIKAIDLDPAFAYPYVNRAACYAEKGDLGKALEDANKAIELSPKLAQAYNNRGNVFREMHNHDRAMSDFAKAIELNPSLCDTYCSRGLLHEEMGNREKADTDYARALMFDPSDTRTARLRTNLRLGKSNLSVPSPSQNEAYLRAVKGRPATAVRHLDRGNALRDEGNLEGALDEYGKAIELDPTFAAAFNSRGVIHLDRGESELALVDLNRALELDPGMVEAYNNRGRAYVDAKELDRAVDDLRRATELDPKLAAAHVNLGRAHAGKGEREKAFAEYNAAIQLDPQCSQAYMNRGVLCVEEADYDRAIDNFNKAIELKPADAEVYYNRGAAFFIQGEFDRSISDCTKAIELNPRFAAAYNNRAVAYACKGYLPDAWKDVKRCEEVGGTPNAAFLQQLRKASGMGK